MQIENIKARQILDSRGNPTVEVDVILKDGSFGRAAVPSGASTGTHEALELRDGEKEHFQGKGVTDAVEHIQNNILPVVVGQTFGTQSQLDQLLINLDGTDTKSRLGANAILGTSLAFARATAESLHIPLFQYINQLWKHSPAKLPRPMFNILNGGEHANWSVDVQEFMVIPVQAVSFAEMVEIGSEVFHSLESILKQKGLSVNVGNEGGFAPNLNSNTQAFDLIMEAIQKAGFIPGTQVALGMDIAASELIVPQGEGESDDNYHLKAEGKTLTRTAWVETIQSWMDNYPIISIEDPFGEDSWTSWQEFMQNQGQQLQQVVGDDLLVTNVNRINQAITTKACNALLVKVNQIGTFTETLQAMELAHTAGWQNVVSHRSGETEDTFIAHLAVGTGCGQIKTGAPSRGERTAKYNELLRIAERLQS